MTGGRHECMRQWEPEEDQLILHLLQQLGPKWSRIVQQLPGRTISSVRNRWQRIDKGRKLREAGQQSKNRCQQCGQPKRGHVCLAKLGRQRPANAGGEADGASLGAAWGEPLYQSSPSPDHTHDVAGSSSMAVNSPAMPASSRVWSPSLGVCAAAAAAAAVDTASPATAATYPAAAAAATASAAPSSPARFPPHEGAAAPLASGSQSAAAAPAGAPPIDVAPPFGGTVHHAPSSRLARAAASAVPPGATPPLLSQVRSGIRICNELGFEALAAAADQLAARDRDGATGGPLGGDAALIAAERVPLMLSPQFSSAAPPLPETLDVDMSCRSDAPLDEEPAPKAAAEIGAEINLESVASDSSAASAAGEDGGSSKQAAPLIGR